MTDEAQQMVMIQPDDGDEQVAYGVADRRRPQGQERRECRFFGRLELQHHDGDDHREHGIGESAQSIGGGLLFMHGLLLIARFTNHPTDLHFGQLPLHAWQRRQHRRQRWAR
jgi:hypothetical protein